MGAATPASGGLIGLVRLLARQAAREAIALLTQHQKERPPKKCNHPPNEASGAEPMRENANQSSCDEQSGLLHRQGKRSVSAPLREAGASADLARRTTRPIGSARPSGSKRKTSMPMPRRDEFDAL